MPDQPPDMACSELLQSEIHLKIKCGVCYAINWILEEVPPDVYVNMEPPDESELIVKCWKCDNVTFFARWCFTAQPDGPKEDCDPYKGKAFRPES